uniref:E3 ubiquitin-protein ligase FANCL n=1 Tax=Phallusia mammillata TaxID=59560 RepID=A0A6F9DBX6_9ASCI|nr:E3 ubiquitin-protein ligase FANCL [Phallusia mammillata]
MEKLLPLDCASSKFDGFVCVNGKPFRVHIVKPSGSLQQAKFSCDWKLQNLLKKHLPLLQKRLTQCKNLEDFIDEVQTLASHSPVAAAEKKLSNIGSYGTIIQHIEELGWEFLNDISDDFTQIQLKVCDSNERVHMLSLSFDANYPQTSPKVSSTLPFSFVPLWASGSSLSTLCSQFKTTLLLYERFWDEVEELKYNTWILEPECPNFSATTFRIALGSSCSMHLKVDPLHPEVLPECQFLGADWAISPYRVKFQAKFEDWNETLSIFQNLKNLLEIDFPHKPHDGSQSVSLQCGICYAYRLETDIPDQICNERRCGQAFHHQCLLEWIQTIPGTKQSFNILFGECPYCTKPIKLPILHK